MGLFSAVTDLYRQSEATVVVQNLLQFQADRGLFKRDIEATATALVTNVWAAKARSLDGSQGKRPNKLTVAAAAFCHAIRPQDHANPGSASYIYALCLVIILQEVSDTPERHGLHADDHRLLIEIGKTFEAFGQQLESTALWHQFQPPSTSA